MGLPEGWTKYGADGEEILSSHRYRALGNAIALPCAEYIMAGIAEALTKEVQMTVFEAYITNLGKYAEGQLVGETLKFPATTEEVQSLLKNIGVDGVRYEEFFITAFDGDVMGLYDYLTEYENLDELNHLAHLISELDSDEIETLEAVLNKGDHRRIFMEQERNSNRNAELAMEQNGNMIDGIINNLPVPPSEKKPLDKVREHPPKRRSREREER